MNIKEVLNNLDENDKRLWQMCRTEMHRTFLTALHEAMGVGSMEADDIAFLDLIDIKLALMFERAGRFKASVHADTEKANEIEAAIAEKAKALNKPTGLALVDKAAGTQGGW